MTLAGRVRLTSRLSAIAALTLVCVPLHWSAERVGSGRSPWPRRYLRWVGRVVGAQVTVVGRPLPRDVVFVSNHVSPLDILVLAGVTGTAFVAMAELEGAPVVGALCDMNNTLYVDRADRSAVADQIATVRTALSDGWPVALFPEGTPGDGRVVAPFKPALLGRAHPATARCAGCSRWRWTMGGWRRRSPGPRKPGGRTPAACSRVPAGCP